MSADLHARILSAIEAEEAIARAATPGPWEPGYVWGRAGVATAENRYIPFGQCAYCHLGEPSVVDPAMDINGKPMLGHLHRLPDPYDTEHSISGANGWVVLQGSGDYDSHLLPTDAAHIAAQDPATTLRRLAEDRDVLARHQLVLDERDREVCAGCDELCHSRSGLMCNDPDAPWPCADVLSIARRHAITIEGAPS